MSGVVIDMRSRRALPERRLVRENVVDGRLRFGTSLRFLRSLARDSHYVRLVKMSGLVRSSTCSIQEAAMAIAIAQAIAADVRFVPFQKSGGDDAPAT